MRIRKEDILLPSMQFQFPPAQEPEAPKLVSELELELELESEVELVVARVDASPDRTLATETVAKTRAAPDAAEASVSAPPVVAAMVAEVRTALDAPVSGPGGAAAEPPAAVGFSVALSPSAPQERVTRAPAWPAR